MLKNGKYEYFLKYLYAILLVLCRCNPIVCPLWEQHTLLYVISSDACFRSPKGRHRQRCRTLSHCAQKHTHTHTLQKLHRPRTSRAVMVILCVGLFSFGHRRRRHAETIKIMRRSPHSYILDSNEMRMRMRPSATPTPPRRGGSRSAKPSGGRDDESWAERGKGGSCAFEHPGAKPAPFV